MDQIWGQSPHPKRNTDGYQAYEKHLDIAIKDLQIKASIKYHYTCIRVAKIQNTDSTNCCPGCGATATVIC